MLHLPGLGSFFISAGKKPSTVNGSEKPIPMKTKKPRIVRVFCVSAKAMAGPRKGAVQGAATRIANIPVRKWPAYPLTAEAFPAVFPPGSVTVKTSNIESEKRKMTAERAVTKYGFCI